MHWNGYLDRSMILSTLANVNEWVCQVFVYNKLVDIFPKHQLFYIIGAFYFALFAAIAIALADPVIGVQNDATSPTRVIGEEAMLGFYLSRQSVAVQVL